MKKIFSLLIFVSIFAINAEAQVTIGSLDAPAKGAVLELKSDTLGFLPPRVALKQLDLPDPLPVHQQGMVVFNTNLTDSLQVGFYYNSGMRWIHLSSTPFKENWFYMPSIYFDTSTNGTFDKDLYLNFKNQLNTSGGLVVSSDNVLTKVLATIPAATELCYFVTAYDDKVFSDISITSDGKMTYKIIGQASDSTFLNIVFVHK